MARDKEVTEIKGIFTSKGKYSWDMEWAMNLEKLKEIVNNEELLEKIREDFEKMNDGTRFSAQVVKVSGKNHLGDLFERYVISLGHFIYSHHYTYWPSSNNWHETILNQEFFEDVIAPFQKKRSWQAGDGLSKTKKITRAGTRVN